MKRLTVFLLVIVLFTNCINLSKENKQTIENIETQFFEISIGEATTITTKGGVIIKIQENTFISDSKTIQLEVQEILTRADLIRSQISTITKDGKLLETGGMLNITTTSDAKINPDALITVKVPSKGLDIDMKLFEAVNKDGKVVWSLKSDLENQALFDNITSGKKLYIKECSACHSKDLSKFSTGPVLGNITAHRPKEWLRNFTRNAVRMIENRDSLALCNWANWEPTVMTSFEYLTDDEIDNIYSFIENETLLNGLDTMPDYLDCDSIPVFQVDTTNFTMSDFGYAIDTSTTYIPQPFNPRTWYLYTIGDFNFTNIDRFIFTDTSKTIQNVQPFEVTIDKEPYIVFIILKNRNTLVTCYLSKNDTWMIIESYPDKLIKLPKGEPVKIVAVSADYKKVAVLETTIQDENTYSLKLKPLETSYNDFIESL